MGGFHLTIRRLSLTLGHLVRVLHLVGRFVLVSAMKFLVNGVLYEVRDLPLSV